MLREMMSIQADNGARTFFAQPKHTPPPSPTREKACFAGEFKYGYYDQLQVVFDEHIVRA